MSAPSSTQPATQLTWATAKAAFADVLANFEVRPQQDNLAAFIEQLLTTTVVGLAQAGCGVGKSFGALIPAIARALATGEPIAIATATKALQVQYATKDLPFIQGVLAQRGITFTWAVIKGRSNYACLAKLAEGPEVANVAAIRRELDESPTHTGDFDDFVTSIDPRDRSKLASTSDECPGKRECPFGDECFAELAKKRAWESEIIVVNHSVLITDLQLREKSGGAISLLPELGSVVVDEAHELEEYATSALGSEMTQRKITTLATDVAAFCEIPQLVGPTTAAAQALFDRLNRLMPRGGRERTVQITDNDRLDLQQPFMALIDAIRELSKDVKSRDVHGNDKAAQMRKRLNKRIGVMVETLIEILVAESDDLVRWLEVDQKRGMLLKFAPLHVGDFLAENLWVHPAVRSRETGEIVVPARPRPVVLMSATLAIGTDFTFLAERLGISEYRSFDAGSPFNFPKQLRVFVPREIEIADPSKEESLWRTQLLIAVERMIKAAGGRTMLLFTSTRAMNLAHDALADKLDDFGVTVLKQGEASPRELATRFKDDETSVLFGLKSFMTGMDFQGDTLRITIVDKLPFPVPSDVLFKARCEAIDRVARNKWVDGSFPKLSIPAMALTLIQAAGRQIRTMNDEGLVMIADPRLHTKKYGRQILAALPAGTRLPDVDAAVEYLEELTARRG